MFLDSHLTVFAFRSSFDLLDVVLAFLISILKKNSNHFKIIDPGLQISFIYISFGKRLENSLGHTQNFSPILGQYHFKYMYLKESLTRSPTVNLSSK